MIFLATIERADHGGFSASLVRKDDEYGTTLACDSFDTIAEGERFIDERAKAIGLRGGCGWEDAGDGARVQAWHSFTNNTGAAPVAKGRPPRDASRGDALATSPAGIAESLSAAVASVSLDGSVQRDAPDVVAPRPLAESVSGAGALRGAPSSHLDGLGLSSSRGVR